jgi:putative YhbY family RNA-binding protein
MEKLTGSEARALRARGAKLEASAVIGKKGLSEENIKIINAAFLKSELIKITIRKNAFEDNKKEVKKIAEYFNAQIVQHLGSALLLFKNEG